MRPSGVIVICAMTGRSAASRHPRIACSISARSLNVSTMKTSTPPAASASACSRKNARASSRAVGPYGSIRTPSGPIEPATYRASRATARASSAPARLISWTLSASANRSSRTRFAPNVFVSRTSAPAARYELCSSRTISGRFRFSSS